MVTDAPSEITADDRVAGRVKVDAVCRVDGQVLIAGWCTGAIEFSLACDGVEQPFSWNAFAREDVSAHFGADIAPLPGFVIGVDAAGPVRLQWKLAGGDAVYFHELVPVPAADVPEPLVRLFGPFAARLRPQDQRPVPGSDAAHLAELHRSGLVDGEFYLKQYPDVADSGADPVAHYYFQGAGEGRDPNPLFSTAWYVAQNEDVRGSGANPLLHYLQFGDAEGRKPSIYFDPVYYRFQTGGAAAGGSTLRHYLDGGWRTFSPNEYFDNGYYLEHQRDVADADMEPLSHYLAQGWREHREIHRVFSFVRYRDMLQERLGRLVEPLQYFLLVGNPAGEAPPRHGETFRSPGGARGLQEQIVASQQPSAFFEPDLIGSEALARMARARLFAFYLPQFHPFPENDRWWGKGFTEWSNVTRALPRFVGHHQPRLPRDLGYYDLRNVDTLRAQVDMARRSGVAGFCFYYYWFDGKRLLDAPVEAFLSHPEIDFPFCLMWANENWTRRWDGMESDVLIAQQYRDEDDEALVADFARHFADPRYERVDGRPLLFVYRPGIIPDARRRIAKWRALFEQRHGERPLMLMAQCFGDDDPRPFGLDGAIEFPPHKLAVDLPPVNATLETFDAGLKGHYLAYDDLVQRSRDEPAPGFDLIRTAVPAWDNEARKPARGMGFVGSTPAKYEGWLRELVAWSGEHPLAGEHRYVFVNAWNEWAEGAHLEPDVHHGAAYLNATLRAMVGMPREARPGKEILLVGHDAYQHGAQLLTLNIMRTMQESFGMRVTLLLLEGGPLVEDYRRHGRVHVLSDMGPTADIALDRALAGVGADAAICNTVVTGEIARRLADRGLRIVSLIHELPRLIRERSLEACAKAHAGHASQLVFAAEHVRRGFESIVGTLDERVAIRPQGIYQPIGPDPAASARLRQRLGLPESARIVLNLGYADLRKGFDLFCRVAADVVARDRSVHFVWVGNVQPELSTWLDVDLHTPAVAGHLHLLPFDPDVGDYIAGADIMAMTSREDPFPSTVIEALATGLPVIAFDGGGGYVEAIAANPANGCVVPMADTAAMGDALRDWLGRDDAAARSMRAEDARARYDWRDYVFGLLQACQPGLSKVSVVVPNYNYAAYLPERLASIFDQTYPIYELIVLDDASPDESVDVARALLSSAGREARMVVNERNSGSVFRQWEKGAAMARGDYLWIAEADDAATPRFLEHLLALADDDTVMAFSDSRQVDGEGRELGDSYGFYYRELEDNPLRASGRLAGDDFMRRALAVKNVILNVSAVVFRRSALLATFDRSRRDVREFRMAGDWRLYAELLAQPGAAVAYSNEPDNVHRRHASSVTHSLQGRLHLAEIERVQDYVAGLVELDPARAAEARRYREGVAKQLAGTAEDHR